MAWERRKNYDPLRASGKKSSASPQVSSPRPSNGSKGSVRPTSEGYVEESDSCSELDQHSSLVMSTSFHGGNKTSQRPSSSSGAVSSTRPNRAFALRQKLNSSADSSPRQSHVSWTTSGGGGAPITRMSLRSGGSGAAASAKKNLLMRKTMGDSARSTSSLSSKEAEFQAWKRRKNYNPLRSSLANGSVQQSAVSPAAATRHPAGKKLSTPSRCAAPPPVLQQQQKRAMLLRRGKGDEDDQDEDKPMQRSASFHYPDGLSRVHHNVYSSEDECSTTEDPHGYNSMPWQRQPHSDLLEVNDDEFILPIRSSVVAPLQHVNQSRGGGARGSPKRMEALDNLVISTVYSISTKLCLSSANLIRRAQETVANEEQMEMMDTLVKLFRGRYFCFPDPHSFSHFSSCMCSMMWTSPPPRARRLPASWPAP